jgi:multicomponent K+:H+ antiporter subunit G
MVIAEAVVAALLLTGSFFLLVGSVGLLKLPDLMTRLHAPTKATTLGIGSVLIASVVHFAAIEGRLSIHELLITLFLFLTAPVTAHMVAKAHLHLDRATAERLPPAAGGGGWATLDDAAEASGGTGSPKP